MFWLVMINEQWLCVASVVYDQQRKIWKTITIFVIKKRPKTKHINDMKIRKRKNTHVHILHSIKPTHFSVNIYACIYVWDDCCLIWNGYWDKRSLNLSRLKNWFQWWCIENHFWCNFVRLLYTIDRCQNFIWSNWAVSLQYWT